MNKQLRMRLLPFMIGSLFAMSSAFAQNTSSAIGGRVVDASGAAIGGAEVEIVHIPSGTVSRTTTDADGRYGAQGLRVGGPYRVTVNKTGLAPAEQDDVYLRLAETTTVNMVESGETQHLEAVTVTAVAPGGKFDSENRGLGTNVSARALKDAPMPGRSIQDVARLDPRVVITDRARGEISALGQNSRFNSISVDAVNAGDPFGLSANGLPYVGTPISIDTIEEYNISTANYEVTNRRSVGANINAVTKSGTNDVHGSVYYAYQNANSMVGDEPSKYTGFKKNWTGGFTVGGPIVKDTLFFFLSYEKSKIDAPGPDFGPEGSSATNIVRGVSQADIDRIIAAANTLGLKPGVLGASSTNLDDKRLLAKFDWNINDSHRVSFRYNRTEEVEPVIQTFNATNLSLSSFFYNQNRDKKDYVINFYDDWADNFSTEASWSYADFSQVRSALAQQPAISISLGRDAQGNFNGSGPFINLGEDQFTHYNVLGVKTWNGFLAGTLKLGDHAIKGGMDYQYDEFYNLFGRTQFGSYTFRGIDAFENGQYYQYDLYQPAPGFALSDVAADWSLKQLGWFVQDTWQVNDNLNVQLGLRYDLPKTQQKPVYNARFTQAFGFRNDNTINGNGVIQPRASFNYTFDTERKMQLRGGLGLFQANSLGVWLTNPYQNNGITVATFQCQPFVSNTRCATPPAFSADPFHQNVPPPSNSQMAVDTLDPDFKQPTVWKGSLAFDYELPWWGTVFTAEYQGIKVKDGIYYQNLNIGAPTGTLPDGRFTYYRNPTGGPSGNGTRNNANPAFAQGVTLLTNTSKGRSDNLSLSLTKPFADNWVASIGTTFGKATEVNPGTSSQATSNFSNNWWVNPNEDVASESNYSIRYRLNASLTWQHKFFGDYTTAISAFYDGHSGVPYSWAFGNDANGDSYSRDLVYIPTRGTVNFQQNTPQAAIDQFWNFIQNDSYLRDHQGQIAKRNAVRSPWVNLLDLSFRQEIPGLFAGHRGEIKLDVANVLNLLNSDWGRERRIGFPYGRTLANYQGVGADGKYIYSLPTDAQGNYVPGQLITYDDKAVSRWSVMATLRYTF